MKCRKCGKEIEDKSLICPECGTVQKIKKKGPHYNYANDIAKAAVTKITDNLYDEKYEQAKRKNVNKELLKNRAFLIVNILYTILLPLLIYIIFRKISLALILFETCVPFWIISVTSYELMFNKAGKKWYMGLIPIARLVTLLQIRNDQRLKDQLEKCEPAFLVWLLLAFFYYSAGGGLAGLITIGYMVLCAFVYTFGLYIWYRINVLKELAARFNKGSRKNMIKTILFPFIMIMLYGYFDKYKYTKLNDSYL